MGEQDAARPGERPCLIETDARGVATLTLNRPGKRNALSPALIAALTEAAERLGSDPAVRAVILTGAGETFCAGGDLDWMRAQFAADRAERIAEAGRLAAMLGALNGMPKPLIGRVQGGTFGGGVGLMAVCDLCLVAEDARFGLTETRLGLIPATISPYVTARIGEAGWRRCALSGRSFGAAEAVALGLAARAVPTVALEAAAREEAEAFLAAAPGAVARAKALGRWLGPRIDAGVIAETVERLADAWEDAEAREGVSAFFERRRPGWTA